MHRCILSQTLLPEFCSWPDTQSHTELHPSPCHSLHAILREAVKGCSFHLATWQWKIPDRKTRIIQHGNHCMPSHTDTWGVCPEIRQKRTSWSQQSLKWGRTWKVQQGKVQQLSCKWVNNISATEQWSATRSLMAIRNWNITFSHPKNPPQHFRIRGTDAQPLCLPSAQDSMISTNFQTTDRTWAGLQEQHKVPPLLLSRLAYSLGKGKGI